MAAAVAAAVVAAVAAAAARVRPAQQAHVRVSGRSQERAGGRYREAAHLTQRHPAARCFETCGSGTRGQSAWHKRGAGRGVNLVAAAKTQGDTV